MLYAEILEGLACGITGIRIPSLDIIEMSLKLIDSFSGEVELPAVLEFPFIAVEYGQRCGIAAIGGTGLIVIPGEILHLLVSALHHEDRPLHVPGAPADFQAVIESVISSGDCIEISRFSGRSAAAVELAVPPIAEADRFFVIVPVMHVPGDPFGFVFGKNSGLISLISQPGVIEP